MFAGFSGHGNSIYNKFRGWPFNVAVAPSCLKHTNLILFAFTRRLMSFAACPRLCSRDSTRCCIPLQRRMIDHHNSFVTNIYKRHNTFFTNIYIYIYILRVETGVNVRDRDRETKTGDRLEGLISRPFLNPPCDSIFRVLPLLSFAVGWCSLPLGTRRPLAGALQTSWVLDRDSKTARLTVTRWILVYIGFLNAYTFFQLSTRVSCFRMFAQAHLV